MDFGFSPRRNHVAEYIIWLVVGVAIGFASAYLFFNRGLERSIDTASEIARGSESLGNRLSEFEQLYSSVGTGIGGAIDRVDSVKESGVDIYQSNRDIIESNQRIREIYGRIENELSSVSEFGESGVSRIEEIKRIIDQLEFGIEECTCER